MTQKSFVWAGIALGDADQAPYDADEWSDIWNILFIRDNTDQGYIEGYLNELIVSNTAGTTIRVATGAALVDGTFYENDANIDTQIDVPAVSTRIDRVVLRKSWAAQTVRVAFLTGAEGGGAPTLTQTDGVTWEISLAQVSITTGSVITITDERVLVRTPLAPEDQGAMIEIETVNGGGVSTDLDFQNIPSTYRHLMIIGTGRSSSAATTEDMSLQLNNDGGANYDFNELEGQGSSPVAAAVTGATSAQYGKIVADSGSANHAGSFQIFIPYYKDTDFYKTFICEWGAIPDSTTTNFRVGLYTGIWNSTVAINRITLMLTGNWMSGSQATLYGIR